MPKPKTESMRVRMSTEQKRRYQKAADALDIDFSRFARDAMDREVERLRGEGKKL